VNASIFYFLDRIYRILWIFLFCHFPDESGKPPSAFGGKCLNNKISLSLKTHEQKAAYNSYLKANPNKA